MTKDSALPPPLQRVSSGVGGLDVILGGGLVAGGLYLIEGPPGTGKTIVANQICFHRARAGERALYITLLAESHGKMLAHLRSMSFFDESLVFRSVIYLSGYRPLVEGGTSGLLAMLGAAVHEHRPSVLVIDGVRSVQAFAAGDNAFAVFIHELNVFVTTARCTALLLAPYERDVSQPEHTLVDGMIELARVQVGLRMHRELVVHKQRGGPYLYGRHVCKIDGDGLTVFPRLEAVVSEALTPAAAAGERRLTFDIARLDAMIGGGLLAGSMTGVVGPPGVGKTLLGLKFLEAGVGRGEPSLYFGFYETPERLLAKAAHTRIDVADAVASGLLRLIWHPPLEQLLDELAAELLADVRARGVVRVVIDGLDGLRGSTTYAGRAARFIVALTAALRELGVTALLTEEAASPTAEVRSPLEDVSAVVENLILMRYLEAGATVHRLLLVSKLRDSGHDPSAREFHITGRGFEFAASRSSAERLLSGGAEGGSGSKQGRRTGGRG